MGKACVRFKTLDALPLDVIGEAVSRSRSTPTSRSTRHHAPRRSSRKRSPLGLGPWPPHGRRPPHGRQPPRRPSPPLRPSPPHHALRSPPPGLLRGVPSLPLGPRSPPGRPVDGSRASCVGWECPHKRRGERGHACCATAGLGPLARETADHRRENYLQTQHSTRPALEQPPVEATSLGTQPASLRCALTFYAPDASSGESCFPARRGPSSAVSARVFRRWPGGG